MAKNLKFKKWQLLNKRAHFFDGINIIQNEQFYAQELSFLIIYMRYKVLLLGILFVALKNKTNTFLLYILYTGETNICICKTFKTLNRQNFSLLMVIKLSL